MINKIIIKFIFSSIFLINFLSCKDQAKEDKLIVKFIGYEESDLPYYYFKGTRTDTATYYFSIIPKKYDLVDKNGQVNQKYANRFFEIEWGSVEPKTNGKYNHPYNEIKSIEYFIPSPFQASEFGIDTNISSSCPNCGSNEGFHPHETIPTLKICNACGIGY